MVKLIVAPIIKGCRGETSKRQTNIAILRVFISDTSTSVCLSIPFYVFYGFTNSPLFRLASLPRKLYNTLKLKQCCKSITKAKPIATTRPVFFGKFIMNAVKEYVEASELQRLDDINIIDEFEDEVSKMHGRSIDIGCGPGNITRQYLLPKLPFGATVVGCDISRKMVDYAKITNSEEGRLSFMELDTQTECLPTNQMGAYDNAVSFYCMHWCTDIRKAFENVYQILRPRGASLVTFVADTAYFDVIMKLQENSKYAMYMEDASKKISSLHNCKNSRAVLKKILKECGFRVIHCSIRDKKYTFENSQAMKKFIKGINPFSERMPVDLRDEFENDFTHEFTKTTIVVDESGKQRQMMMYRTLVAYMKKT